MMPDSTRAESPAPLPRDPGATPYATTVAGTRQAARIPRVRDLLHADICWLRPAFSTPEARSSRLFRLIAAVLSEKDARHEMRILYCPPLTLLWTFLPGNGSTASELHKFYCHEIWRERGGFARLQLLAGMLLWPIVTVGTMFWFTALNGSAIKRRCGKSIGRQMLAQLQVAALYAVLPPWYYMFELFDDQRRRQASEYLHRFETTGGIFRFLKRVPCGVTRTPLTNKLLFAQHCREHGIPTAPVLLTIEAGETRPELSQLDNSAPRLPDVDLFVKPTGGRGGLGAQRWNCEAPGCYRNAEGTVRTTAELLAYVRDQSELGRCIVQPRMVNHPAIAELSNGALSTVRLMTIENEHGGWEATHAVLRMAVGTNTTVDNFHAGGIAAQVDLQTGMLGSATDVGLRPEMGWRECHPDTGARITGRLVPFWEETVRLAVRAHAAFSDRVVIGWDIAILSDGPIIIEGNTAPDVDILERVCREPLGNSRFGELLVFHLRRALETRRNSTKPRTKVPLPEGDGLPG
jgi:hypothetical protein